MQSMRERLSPGQVIMDAEGGSKIMEKLVAQARKEGDHSAALVVWPTSKGYGLVHYFEQGSLGSKKIILVASEQEGLRIFYGTKTEWVPLDEGSKNRRFRPAPTTLERRLAFAKDSAEFGPELPFPGDKNPLQQFAGWMSREV